MLTGRRWGGTASIAAPSSSTRPSLGVSKPASRRSNVLLPQPEGPSSAKNSPAKMSRVGAATAPGGPARLRAVIIAEPHHGPRVRQDRDHAVEQRLAGHRLLEELVDAELLGALDAPALDVAAEHDDRHVGNQEHAGGAHDARHFRPV